LLRVVSCSVSNGRFASNLALKSTCETCERVEMRSVVCDLIWRRWRWRLCDLHVIYAGSWSLFELKNSHTKENLMGVGWDRGWCSLPHLHLHNNSSAFLSQHPSLKKTFVVYKHGANATRIYESLAWLGARPWNLPAPIVTDELDYRRLRTT